MKGVVTILSLFLVCLARASDDVTARFIALEERMAKNGNFCLYV